MKSYQTSASAKRTYTSMAEGAAAPLLPVELAAVTVPAAAAHGTAFTANVWGTVKGQEDRRAEDAVSRIG